MVSFYLRIILIATPIAKINRKNNKENVNPRIPPGISFTFEFGLFSKSFILIPPVHI